MDIKRPKSNSVGCAQSSKEKAMRGLPSWVLVSGLTGAALALISALAMAAKHNSTSPTTPVAIPSVVTPGPTQPPHPSTPPLPANSGMGKREVYSVSQSRVWVVPPSDSGPIASFLVAPGTVPARPGTYFVSKRKPAGIGTDGAKVEHIIYFEYTAETWVAFSAPIDNKVTKPDPSLHTGAIRGKRADIAKIWNNTVTGSTVVVVS